MGGIRMIPGAWSKTQAIKMSFSPERDCLPRAQSVRRGYETGR